MTAAALQNPQSKKWHDLYPELGTGPVPIEPYVSRAYFELERERIFRRVWLNVARVEQIANPGDCLVRDLPICKTSVLIVRGKDGVIRAFHNMCAHRGNKLVANANGRCRGLLTCKFHGWAYVLDGSISHVADEGSFFNLDRSALALTPIAADTWQGFVFINVDPKPCESLGEYLGAMGRGLRWLSVRRTRGDAVFVEYGNKSELEGGQGCFSGGIAYTDAASQNHPGRFLGPCEPVRTRH